MFIALAAFLVSVDPEKYRLIVWAFIALLVGEILLYGIYLVSGIQTFQQAGPPIIITIVLLVLILLFQVKKEPSSG